MTIAEAMAASRATQRNGTDTLAEQAFIDAYGADHRARPQAGAGR